MTEAKQPEGKGAKPGQPVMTTAAGQDETIKPQGEGNNRMERAVAQMAKQLQEEQDVNLQQWTQHMDMTVSSTHQDLQCQM